MRSTFRECSNCAHFQPSVGFVPNACALENDPSPVADSVCHEHQDQHEVAADRALAIARGAVLRARGAGQ
jgi:hypothetical protein